jgi:mRNA interferase HigB
MARAASRAPDPASTAGRGRAAALPIRPGCGLYSKLLYRPMRVISLKPIRAAQAKWPREAGALDRWYRLAKGMNAKSFAELKVTFPAVDRVGDFYVFDIGGNKIRLIAAIHFNTQMLFVRHVMDHREYDRWKP